MKLVSALFLLIALAFVQTSYAQMKIDGMKFGTAVEKSEVVGEATSFPANGSNVYCWVKVVGGEGQTVTMKWYHGETLKNEVPLEIKSWSMRTYAFYEVHRAGTWKVEIVDSTGKVLQSGEFTATAQ